MLRDGETASGSTLLLFGPNKQEKGTISSTVNLASGANLTSQNGEYSVSSIDATNASVDVSSGSLAVSNLVAKDGGVSRSFDTLFQT